MQERFLEGRTALVTGSVQGIGLEIARMGGRCIGCARVSREQTFHGSFWGNYTDLSEVMALASQGKIRHTIKTFTFDQINEYIDLLRTGEIVGRAVMRF